MFNSCKIVDFWSLLFLVQWYTSLPLAILLGYTVVSKIYWLNGRVIDYLTCHNISRVPQLRYPWQRFILPCFSKWVFQFLNMYIIHHSHTCVFIIKGPVGFTTANYGWNQGFIASLSVFARYSAYSSGIIFMFKCLQIIYAFHCWPNFTSSVQLMNYLQISW